MSRDYAAGGNIGAVQETELSRSLYGLATTSGVGPYGAPGHSTSRSATGATEPAAAARVTPQCGVSPSTALFEASAFSSAPAGADRDEQRRGRESYAEADGAAAG